jgi:predicted PurR-regulated permease PerM
MAVSGGRAGRLHLDDSRLRWLLPLGLIGLLLFWARAILPPFIVAAVLAYALSPLVDWLERRLRLPRLLVVGALWLVLLSLLGLALALIEIRLVAEVRDLGRAGPDLADSAVQRLLGRDSFEILGQTVDPHELAIWTGRRLTELAGRPTDALHVAASAVDTLLKLVLSLLALFYLLLDGRRFGAYLLRFAPAESRADLCVLAERIHRVLGRYLRGQLFLVGLMAGLTYALLELVFRLPFALPVALATGVLEVIPIVGPIAAGAIAALIALGHAGPGLALGVIGAYFVLRMAEDQLVMPIVVGRSVDLHPLVTMFAVLLGGSTAGVLGAVLAVPAAAALRVLIEYSLPAESEPAPASPPPGAAGPAVRNGAAHPSDHPGSALSAARSDAFTGSVSDTPPHQ